VLGDDYQKERIELIVLEGNPIIQIVKAAYRIGAHRIVMGRREKYDMLDKVMGTVSLGVIKSAQIPTLLIPANHTFQYYESVLVTLDSDIDDDHLELVNEWNKLHNATLHISHVAHPFDNTRLISKELNDEVKDELNSAYDYQINLSISKDPAETIINTAENGYYDLIIMFPKREGLIRTIFLNSMVKQVAQKSNTPMLFLFIKHAEWKTGKCYGQKVNSYTYFHVSNDKYSIPEDNKRR
jgi:nucleotide-binding universal stress UspA family protein